MNVADCTTPFSSISYGCEGSMAGNNVPGAEPWPLNHTLFENEVLSSSSFT